MPLLIGTEEWAGLTRGLVQRADLLERVIADLYGQQTLVKDGHLPAAVVAGNVETSQVVTDALFGAFGAMAGAQGTMNNLTFGNKDSLDFSWRHVRSTPGLRPAFVTSPRNYKANQWSAVYLLRF